MAGVETAFAVIGATAALIIAYRDGGNIIQQIKDRRRQRHGNPPTRMLEEALQRGQTDIEKNVEDGVDRFGTAFEKGDDLAVQALRVVTIKVLASLLRPLLEAVRNDSFDDFSQCVDSAIGERLKAINILNNLQLRQQERAQGLDGQQAGKGEALGTAGVASAPAQLKSTRAEITDPPAPQKKPKLLGRLSWKRRTSSEDDAEHKSHGPHPKGPHDLPRGTHKAITDSSDTAENSLQAEVPTSPNIDFHSFCKGAYYLQASLNRDGLKIVNQSEAKTGENSIWACRSKKCAFEVPARRGSGKRWLCDDRILNANSIRYRWLFLAKSHIDQRRIKKGLVHYRSLSCALEAPKDVPPIHEGERALLEHLADHLSTNFIASGLWYFTTDRLLEATEETFDVFLPNHSSIPSRTSQPPSSVASIAMTLDRGSSTESRLRQIIVRCSILRGTTPDTLRKIMQDEKQHIFALLHLRSALLLDFTV